MSEVKSTQFSDWITSRSNMASDVNQTAITKVLAKLEEQRAAKLEKQTMAIFQTVQSHAATLREIRQREKGLLSQLAKLNAAGDKLLAGGYSDDDLADLDAALDRDCGKSTLEMYVLDLANKKS